VIDPNCALPPVAPTQCAVCGTGMLPLERAARLCRRNRRVLYRWVEEGRSHFCKLADGSVAICGKTLAIQMNELETNTAQLAGQADSMPGPAAITLTDPAGFCPIIPQNRGAALNRRSSFGAASFIYDSNTTDNTCAVAGAGSQPLQHAANQSSAN
jgi:hypothetical protein